MIGEYVTEENLRLLAIGAGSSALMTAALGLLRSPPAWIVGWLAPALGLFAADRVGWRVGDLPSERWVAAGVVGLLAGHGYERLGGRGAGSGSGSAGRWVPVLGLLAALGGVWLAVPENSPAAVVIGVVLGLALVGAVGGRRTGGWGVGGRGVGYGLGVAVAWTVLVGARPWGYSFDGGLLCLAPLVAVGVLDVAPVRGRAWLPAWPWFVIGAGGLAFAAARWVGVAPDATWGRVGVVAGGALALAVPTRR